MLAITQTAPRRFIVHETDTDRVYGRYPSHDAALDRVVKLARSQKPSAKPPKKKKAKHEAG